jgi:putative ubiquitin-RnfH superfamily antitoxin RatB of RatAB toxin-antitoxin module
VLYARPEEQLIVSVSFEHGMTAADAVERSGLTERFPEIGAQVLVLGVWGKEVSAAHELKPGDRIEISRPLKADPRDMRREYMTDGRVMGGAAAPVPGVRKKVRE